MDEKTVKLSAAIDVLEEMYGPLKPPVTAPFDIILHENASYLVDDARRMEVFRALQSEIGSTPEAILEHRPKAIEKVIASGGMLPLHRTEKVIKAARIAAKVGLAAIDDAIRTDLKKARKLLTQFPGGGDPLADKILLFAGVHTCVAPESNALRVLVRLGYGIEDEKNYAKMYRSAVESCAKEFETAKAALRAHLLLRHHGQNLCKRSEPRCEACRLRSACSWYAEVSAT